MAAIYFYCSYEGGKPYQLGKVTKRDQTQLSTKDLNPFIRKCLETLHVDAAAGRDPLKANQFFLITPRLQIQGDPRKYGASKFNVQIAVVVQDVRTFRALMKPGNSEQEIAAAIRDAMVVKGAKDRNFGFDINPKAIGKITNLNFGEVLPGVDQQNAEKMTYVHVDQNLDRKQIGQLAIELGLNKNEKMTKTGKTPGWMRFQSTATQEDIVRVTNLTKRKPVDHVVNGRVI